MARASLHVDADPGIWLIGPTEDRPYKKWLPAAVDVLCGDFGVSDDDGREYVTAVLEVFGRDDDSPLSERMLRWRGIEDQPFPVRFGMVTRDGWSEEDVEAYLGAGDLMVVEPPVIEQVEQVRDGRRVRRSLSYSLDEGELVVSVRYVAESATAPTLLALLHAAAPHPNLVVEALPDLDDLCRTLHAEGRA